MRIDPNRGLNDAEFLSYNTVRIVSQLSDGDTGLGTGFLYQFLSTNRTSVKALVTNKHVLDNTQTATLVFNPTGEDNKIDFKGEKTLVKFPEFSTFWHSHPNPDIDLAFVPLAPIIDELAEEKKYPFLTFFRSENFPKINM